MKLDFKYALISFLMVFVFAVCFAQIETALQDSVSIVQTIQDTLPAPPAPTPLPLPVPPFSELPELIIILLGLVSATVTEAVQKGKTKLASLGIAVGVSVIAGIVGSLVHGIGFADFPLFISQVFVLSTTSWAVLFKGLGLSSKLNHLSEN